MTRLFFFQPEHLYCLSHRQTHWTIWMNNVGLQICLLETLNFILTKNY